MLLENKSTFPETTFPDGLTSNSPKNLSCDQRLVQPIGFRKLALTFYKLN